MSKTRIYKYWGKLVYQSANPNSKRYKGYIVCEDWQNFRKFFEDMNEGYQEGLCLKVINTTLPYSKENCVWVTKNELHRSHGMVGIKFYQIWARLKHHRTNPTAKAYEGTSLCKSWQMFENFKADMYDSYQEGMGLKLLDTSKPYSKENCCWITRCDLLKKHPMWENRNP